MLILLGLNNIWPGFRSKKSERGGIEFILPFPETKDGIISTIKNPPKSVAITSFVNKIDSILLTYRHQNSHEQTFFIGPFRFGTFVQ